MNRPPTQPKQRRKYASKACRECRRRKIRCDGRVPCHRCSRQGVDCTYTDEHGRNEHSSQNNPQTTRGSIVAEHISSLQDHIVAIATTVESLKNGVLNQPARVRSAANFRPSLSRVGKSSWTGKSSFHGSTTSAFTMDLAKTNLREQGIIASHETGQDLYSKSLSSPAPSDTSAPIVEGEIDRDVDPLGVVGKIEALRLCNIYEEEMGIQYPILDISELLAKVEILYNNLDNISSVTNPEPNSLIADGLDQADVTVIRLVLACALTAEGSGQSKLALDLFDGLQNIINACIWGSPRVNNMIILLLVATFYFQTDHERLAWRTIGFTARMCLDAGLHRHETLANANADNDRRRMLRLFWCTYVLDIRWSFGTGRPFSFKDVDIDPLLPRPDDQTPYLQAMVPYSRIAGQVWEYLSAFDHTHEMDKDKMQYLSWQIQTWSQDLPDNMHIRDPFKEHTREQRRSTRRLRALLYMRAQQLQLLIYRPVLQSASNITQHPNESDALIKAAQDIIRFIDHVNETSNIYQLQQVAFNWFLTSALAALFLAVAHQPARFNTRCKDEFYLALKLVKRFSTQSYVCGRLWKSIRGLKELAQKLGLPCATQSNATVSGYPANQDTGSLYGSLDYNFLDNWEDNFTFDGEEISRELTGWYEYVANFDGQANGMETVNMGDVVPPMAGQTFPNTEELYDSMRDCF